MRRFVACAVFMMAGLLPASAELRAQSRADSAAVLLEAAEQLRLRGEAGAARAVLELIADRYPGTAAAAEVERMLAALRRAPEREQSGRTELLVAGTIYGAWLGVAVPLMMDSDEPSAYGAGLLLGAPGGFLAARSYADAHTPTEGQARALTFGGTWGTWQGVAWAEVLDIGRETEEICTANGCYEIEDGPGAATYAAAAVLGGLAGIGTGAVIARKPITSGTAAAVSLGGMWGTWFGFALSTLAGVPDDDLLLGTLIGGNAALVATALVAPSWNMTESRARIISVGGLIGGLAGAGTLLILEPDDEQTAVAIPLVTSSLGLLIAAARTRPDVDDADAGPGRGALLNVDGGRWGFDMPAATLRLARGRAGIQPALYMPLVQARF